MTNEIVQKQRAFFRSGKTLFVNYRKKYLTSLKKTILESEGEIADALKSDLGKGMTESYMCEIGLSLSELRYVIRNVERFARKRRVKTPLAQFPAKSYIIPEPYGNTLIMSPWNYPFLLCISPLVSAIAAGNTAIIKPSAYSPATSAIIKKIITNVFPEEYVTVIEGGREVNSDLLEQKFDYIFFTGSKGVGKTVMEKAAAHLTPVTLELGGKSPVIVTEDAHLKVAADRIVFGKYLNCGQTCVAPDYILVHENIADKFIQQCKVSITEMFGDNPLDNMDYGHIVNRKHYERLCSYIDEVAEARDLAEVIFSGNTPRDPKSMRIAPTIIKLGSIKDRKYDSLKSIQEEIFGPIMPVLTFNNQDDVVTYIDGRPRPLATYIFTSDKETKERLLRDLHFGGGCVNDTIIHLATDSMPFGGVGESGMGNYHGKYGFETFSHLKSITDKPTWLDLPMRYQPYTSLKNKLIRIFLK